MPECPEGKHPIPKKWAFESQGAVFQGGICPKCGKLVQGKFLGNAWIKEIESSFTAADLNSPPGERLARQCTLEILASPEKIGEIMDRFHKACGDLPKKKQKVICLSGLDFSKFEKKGYIVKQL